MNYVGVAHQITEDDTMHGYTHPRGTVVIPNLWCALLRLRSHRPIDAHPPQGHVARRNRLRESGRIQPASLLWHFARATPWRLCLRTRQAVRLLNESEHRVLSAVYSRLVGKAYAPGALWGTAARGSPSPASQPASTFGRRGTRREGRSALRPTSCLASSGPFSFAVTHILP